MLLIISPGNVRVFPPLIFRNLCVLYSWVLFLVSTDSFVLLGNRVMFLGRVSWSRNWAEYFCWTGAAYGGIDQRLDQFSWLVSVTQVVIMGLFFAFCGVYNLMLIQQLNLTLKSSNETYSLALARQVNQTDQAKHFSNSRS